MMNLSVTLNDREKLFGWCYLAFEFLVLPALLQMLPLNPAGINIAAFVINFLVLGAIFFPFLKENLQTVKMRPQWFLTFSLCCFIVFYGINTVVTMGILILRPDFANLNDANLGQMASQYYWPMFLCTVVLVPISEELLFRGLIFGSVYPKSRVLAYCVSVLAFAAPHVLGYIGSYDAVTTLLSLIQYLPAGICLAFAYEKADSIWAPILIHSAVNGIAMLAVR